MSNDTLAFPPLHVYALAHRCPTCGAKPDEPCDAPRKAASAAEMDAIREQVGQSPLETDPLQLMHRTRQDAGIRHYDRDVRKAPWPEDREPGRRYDTLGPA
ncbi:hypothetical protein [Streptomyces misionensis]|uniref:hypothetical protein n=1 Tax=Streptomyces misionensis TaxID=67331 RepID=UPI00396B9471